MARRRRPPEPEVDSGIPAELRSRFDPIWSDPTRLAAEFPRYVEAGDLRRLGMSPHASEAVRLRVLGRWALAHGITRSEYPTMPDWHRLNQEAQPPSRRVQMFSISTIER